MNGARTHRTKRLWLHRNSRWQGLGRCVALFVVALALSPAAFGDDEFSRTVRPLLAARCGSCHGRDKREGGLSLADRQGALAALESGAHAIVPGQPAQSALLQRVTSLDADERMPPKGAPLSAAEVAVLRRWIEAGAPWDIPWAYRPLEARSRPVLRHADAARRAAGPIDVWIEAGLAERNLAPMAEADARTLIRRVSFDLTGLPPTPEEIAAHVGDGNPDAWQRLIDRLLASPRLGERWARHWMDIVHFAETHGHDQDRPRLNAWPYRDYLIRAFNGDRPYARFVQEQVAGDVLDPLNPDANIATGFLATGPWDESSLRDIRDDTIDRQIARYLDRDDIVATTMGTFVSTTVHCARCHDHKFDPVSQADYFRLQAVFAGTDKAERAYDADAETARRRRDLRASLDQLAARRAARDMTLLAAPPAAEIAAWETRLAAQRDQWIVLIPAAVRSSDGSQLSILPDGSVLSGGTRPERDTYTIVALAKLPRITGIRLEVLTDASLPHQGPGRQDNGNLHLSELVVSVSSAAADGAKSGTLRRLMLKNPRADFDQVGWTIAHALDENSSTAWGIHPQVGKPHRASFELVEPIDAVDGVTLTVELKQLHGGGHLIGRPRVSATGVTGPARLDAETLPAAIAAIVGIVPDQRSVDQRLDLAEYVLRQHYEAEIVALPPPRLVYAGTSRFQADGTFKPAERPRTVQVLARGDIRQPGAEMSPGALALLAGLSGELAIDDPQDEGQRRAALAGWLSDVRNGLAWRSIVNRWWHYHFGRGLVDTPNDFGAMGGLPSHPELIDELALRLQQHDGSLQWLHREMVTSAAYRRSTRHEPSAAAVDADNRGLWRMNRTRLDAESIRDALLVLSDTLDRRMGGPSDQQFVLSPGVHVTPVVDYARFDAADRANYRRSVYRFVFRTLPDPFLEALDCVDASQWTPARNVSVTALQALALLNDKFVVRQCEHLAERIEDECATVDAQVRRLFELVLLRAPTLDERSAVGKYVEQHGLENACRWLVNSNEFVFVD